MQEGYEALVGKQREFFSTGAALPVTFRIEQLHKLKYLIETHQSEILAALQQDLHKSTMEAMLSEVLFVLEEIDFTLKRLKKWAAPARVPTPFPVLWPGRSYIHKMPYGCVLIISPWNYPFMLLMSPLVGALSAGNCVVLKPSEIAAATAQLISRLIHRYFPAAYLTVVEGDVECVQLLLKEKWDYIFFTGGLRVGKVIMKAAVEHLTPITLELGGKSPCIVDETANLPYAARRIIWAKMLNAGQTCVAPDYVYVHHSCKAALIDQMKRTIKDFFGESPLQSESYGRIINQAQVERLKNLMKAGRIVAGGVINQAERYIEPTLLDDISWDDPIMQEEIFGPLLPLFTFDKIEDVIEIVRSRPKPLALYLFTNQKKVEEKVVKEVSFGGGCINDCVMHLANLHLPFGGVGTSGMGRYHGQYSFDTFSQLKSVYKKTLLIDVKLAYPPYSAKKLKYIRLLLEPWKFIRSFFLKQG